MYIFIFFFFFNDTATTEIYTLSLHDALPISTVKVVAVDISQPVVTKLLDRGTTQAIGIVTDVGAFLPMVVQQLEQQTMRSEEHTSELQSQSNLVCRLLLEKKKKNNKKSEFV